MQGRNGSGPVSSSLSSSIQNLFSVRTRSGSAAPPPLSLSSNPSHLPSLNPTLSLSLSLIQYNISSFHFSPPMEDQYGMPDLRHYITSRPLFPPLPQPPDLLRPTHPYDMLIFRSDSTTSATTNAGAASSSGGGCFGGFESGGLNDGGTGRWPRQETLTLLEIRSRLDPKFKEANQKGPLWDEVSRILSEEHGYQRSGKKCREKFENLYKYYKKTKEGKAGRQDGKHYRFFRQLEALYGDNNVINTPAPASVSENHLLGGCNIHSDFHVKNQEPTIQGGDTSLSLSNYSDEPDDTSVSSEDLSNDSGMKKKKKRGGGTMGWKVKIRDFIDTQMKKLMEKQEAWMEKMMRAIENKEQDRMMREEEWRKQDALRIEREHKFWANERAWIEARDEALMEALHKLTGKEQAAAEIHSMSGNQNNDDGSDQTMNNSAMWPEGEINRLIQLRSGMEGRFQERGGIVGGDISKDGVFWT